MQGVIRLAGEDIGALSTASRVRRGLGRTFQIVQLLPEETALDNVALAVQVHRGHSFRFWADARRDRGIARRRRSNIWPWRVWPPGPHVPVAALSHGEQKQLELAVALAGEPRLLLLDEPMAGLGASESRQMLDLLAGLKGRIGMLLVEHDMETVFALADRISVLVYGRVIASGDAAAIQANPEVRVAYLGEGDA